jgi:hypothetical protein
MLDATNVSNDSSAKAPARGVDSNPEFDGRCASAGTPPRPRFAYGNSGSLTRICVLKPGMMPHRPSALFLVTDDALGYLG